MKALGCLLVLCGVCLTGCNWVKVTLQADAETNLGRPLHVLVRSVDEQTYRSESYSAISRLMTAPNNTIVRKLVIDPAPKLKRSFCLKPPQNRPLALYFLYTSPTGNWKMLLLPPLPYSVTVPLRRRGIGVEQVSERRFRSPDSAPPSPPPVPAAPDTSAMVSVPSAPPPPAYPSYQSPPPPSYQSPPPPSYQSPPPSYQSPPPPSYQSPPPPSYQSPPPPSYQSPPPPSYQSPPPPSYQSPPPPSYQSPPPPSAPPPPGCQCGPSAAVVAPSS